MKKWCLPALLVFLFLFGSTVQAAVAPKPGGHLLDSADLFTQDDAKKIEAGVAGRTYELFVSTAVSLSEADGEQLANDTYDAWHLAGNQLMLVITVKPNFLHLVYENAELDNLVSASEAHNTKGILDVAFVPKAKGGDVAAAVLAVSDFVNSLNPSASATPSAGPTPAKQAKPEKAGEPDGAEKMEEKAAKERGASIGGVLLLLFAVFVLLPALIVWLVIRLIARLRSGKKLRGIRGAHRQHAEAINTMMVSDLFHEFDLGFMQEASKQRTGDLQRQVLQLLERSEEIGERLGKFRPSFFFTGKNNPRLEAFRAELEQENEQLVPLQATFAELSATLSEVRRLVGEANQRAGFLTAAVEELAQQSANPLSALRDQLNRALELYAKADKVDEFDFVQAAPQIRAAHDNFNEVENGVHRLRELIPALPLLLPRITACEAELRPILERERLLCVDGDPFQMLKAAREDVPRLGAAIAAGEASRADERSQAIEAAIRGAKELVEGMIRHRDGALQAASEVGALLRGFADLEVRFRAEQERLGETFASVHMKEQEDRQVRMREMIGELKRMLAEIESLLHIDVQKYRAAFAVGEKAHLVCQELTALHEECFAYRQSLERTLNEQSDRSARLHELYNHSHAAYEKLQLRMLEPEEAMADCEAGLQETQLQLGAPGKDMYRIVSALDTCEERVEQFDRLVGQLAHLYSLVYQSLEQLRKDYTKRKRRYRRTINVGIYDADFQAAVESIEQAVKVGSFEEAQQLIASGQTILAYMDSGFQHQRALDDAADRHRRELEAEERRRRAAWDAEERRKRAKWEAEEKRRHGSGGGRSGRSSGSAGWGGGNERSSGSASWGSENGKSSGSAGWGDDDKGSGGGRSSGSSSW